MIERKKDTRAPFIELGKSYRPNINRWQWWFVFIGSLQVMCISSVRKKQNKAFQSGISMKFTGQRMFHNCESLREHRAGRSHMQQLQSKYGMLQRRQHKLRSREYTFAHSHLLIISSVISQLAMIGEARPWITLRNRSGCQQNQCLCLRYLLNLDITSWSSTRDPSVFLHGLYCTGASVTTAHAP